MIRLKEKKILLIVILFILGLTSCEQDASDVKWGITKIYMPQASVFNGGLNNNYPVPLNNNVATKNYEIDSVTNTLKIVLGVYRSGLQALEAYSVKVGVNNDSTSSVVSQTLKGVELPADTYTLPSEVSVANGERQAIFYLSVDLNKLKTKYPAYATRKLCLVVGISDPTKYELNAALSKTNVIINAAAFMPVPVILKDGIFDAGSEQNWLLTSLDGTIPALTDAAKVANGVLTMNYGTTAVTRSIAVYHPISLENGVNYKFSAQATWSGATSAEIFFVLSTVKPITGQNYVKTNNYFTGLDAWMPTPNFSTSGTGTFPQAGKWENGINRSSGEFKANFTDGYVIILATTWGGNIGNVVIDNIKIEEQ